MNNRELVNVFENAIEILKNNKVHLIGNKKFPTNLTYRDVYQRADEVCLLYAEIFNISFNLTKEILKAEELFANSGGKE